jgi:hypothetical protein
MLIILKLYHKWNIVENVKLKEEKIHITAHNAILVVNTMIIIVELFKYVSVEKITNFLCFLYFTQVSCVSLFRYLL